MKYRDLNIQTQREAPNNARTEGFAFLVRAGYLTRENVPTQVGSYAMDHLRKLSDDPSFLSKLSLITHKSKTEVFFPIASGSIEVAYCPECKYTERLELAQFQKTAEAVEPIQPLEKILTPDCHTIEALADFLGVPKEKTAKALMYTRLADSKFVFVVVRGDMQLSEPKLKQHTGAVRPATIAEIERSGAAPGTERTPVSRNLHRGFPDPVNPSDNPTFGEVVLSRRALLKAGLGASAFAALGGCGTLGVNPVVGFTRIPASSDDALRVPPEYEARVLYRWGDPVGMYDGMPAFKPDASNTAA